MSFAFYTGYRQEPKKEGQVGTRCESSHVLSGGAGSGEPGLTISLSISI